MPDFTKRARIYLVDDHVIVLDSCRKLLESRHEVLGESTETRDLSTHIQRLHPDILLMDISMPGQNVFETARSLKNLFPALHIIFLSMYLDPTFIMKAFRSGATGYVSKQTAGSELFTAIQQVLDKGMYLSPLISENIRICVQDQLKGIPGTELSGKLTFRQREILKLVAQGLSEKDMADLLQIAPGTVAFHKRQIIQALGLKSKADLTRFAVRIGLTSLKVHHR
jgi:DNA-binding NarL/FixJ family response regulator